MNSWARSPGPIGVSGWRAAHSEGSSLRWRSEAAQTIEESRRLDDEADEPTRVPMVEIEAERHGSTVARRLVPRLVEALDQHDGPVAPRDASRGG